MAGRTIQRALAGVMRAPAHVLARRCLLAVSWPVLAGGLVLLAGCGEQELYEPPESPFQVSGRLALPSEATDVAVLGRYAYVAAGQSGLHVVDISNPDDPRAVLWLDTPKSADALCVTRSYDADGSRRDLAFIIEGTEGILPYDITPVPDSIVDLRQGTSAYAGNAVCVKPPEFVGDPYILFLADSWRAVTAFVSAPDNPGFLDQRVRAVPYGYTQDLALSADGTHLYVADDEMGVTILDITGVIDRRLPVIGNIDTPGNAMSVAVSGSYVFVAANEEGLHIFRAGEDYLLEPVATLALSGSGQAIEVRDGIAFIAADDAGLQVIDVRDPAHPSLLGSVPTLEAVGVALGENDIVCVADAQEGLIVFRGPHVGADATPPATIANFTARLIDTTSLELSWTAPGDDGTAGTADEYDLRWSPSPIDETNWDAAQKIIRCPLPRAAGTRQATTWDDLTPGARYYFALRAKDEAGNVSPLSNAASALMTVPTLSDGDVDPDEASSPETMFLFTVVYADPEGDAPVVRQVVIDGVAHTMNASGGDYPVGVLFSYQTTLGYGTHDYKFSFDDGHGPLVETQTAFGPDLPPDPFDFTMAAIGSGTGTTFDMGSPAGELGREADETLHPVTLTRGFRLGTTEVNQILFETIMGFTPSAFGGSSRPVESITWYDALAFCNALSAHDQLTPAYTLTNVRTEGDHVTAASVAWDREANGYRLPTEAEWEYACRAGSGSALANGNLTNEHCEADPLLDAVGWYCGNSDQGTGPRTQNTGRRAPNAFGLYDMHGNVWEYCWDLYAAYPDGPATDPSGPDGDEPGAQRVMRGGSWHYFARDCRSASRGAFWSGSRDNTVGFRIARNAE